MAQWAAGCAGVYPQCVVGWGGVLCWQVLSGAVPVAPDELEALVAAAASGEQQLMLRGSAGGGTHSSSELEPAVETAAVA
jgi:hypothetical protein